jgi:hypothetical protein
MQYQSLICIMLLSCPFICCWYEMHERKAYWSGRVYLPVCTAEISKPVALRPIWVTFHINVVRICPCVVSVKVAPSLRLLVCTHGKLRK